MGALGHMAVYALQTAICRASMLKHVWTMGSPNNLRFLLSIVVKLIDFFKDFPARAIVQANIWLRRKSLDKVLGPLISFI